MKMRRKPDYGAHDKCVAIGRDANGRDLVCGRSRGHRGELCFDPSADVEFVPDYKRYKPRES